MDPEKPHSLPGRLLQVFAGLVGLLFLYVLSIGPAAYLATKSDKLIAPIETLYLPLLVAAEVLSVGPPLYRYINWWEALP